MLAARFGIEVKLLGMTTRGDQILDRALSKVGGKGLFVKELETALEEGRAHLAVHSLKDVPMVLPDGFTLAAHAVWLDGALSLRAAVGHPENADAPLLRASVNAVVQTEAQARALGEQAAAALRDAGAAAYLSAVVSA